MSAHQLITSFDFPPFHPTHFSAHLITHSLQCTLTSLTHSSMSHRSAHSHQLLEVSSLTPDSGVRMRGDGTTKDPPPCSTCEPLARPFVPLSSISLCREALHETDVVVTSKPHQPPSYILTESLSTQVQSMWIVRGHTALLDPT